MKLKYITAETLYHIRKWQSWNISRGGGHFMTDDMLKYGLFVPDNSVFVITFDYNQN